ncbi:hypothetical protein M117_4551 [Bacteroides fragilis str. 3774 T13]|nr:hypothetical protein M117_4551 [Bacteroides fragilis str. 3774 T13]
MVLMTTKRDTVSVKSYRYGIFFCPKTGGIPLFYRLPRARFFNFLVSLL